MWTNRSLLLSVLKAETGGCQLGKGLEVLSQSKRKPAQHRARLQRKGVRWVSSPRSGQGLPAGWDWPPRYHHTWVKGAGLETPNCQVSCQFPASFSMLTGKNGGLLTTLFHIEMVFYKAQHNLYAFFFSFLYLFWLYHMAYRILVLQSGTKPASPPLEAKSLNHWTAIEVLNIIFHSSPTGHELPIIKIVINIKYFYSHF